MMPTMPIAFGTSGTVSPAGRGAASVAGAGMSATSGTSSAEASASAAESAVCCLTPKRPDGRIWAPGRAILSVLRCVRVGFGAAAGAASFSGAAAGAAASETSADWAGAELAEADGGSEMSTGRLMRMGLSGAADASDTGATPMASESEMRAVRAFAACFCAAVLPGSAMMPFLWRIACCGISWVTHLRFCVTDLSWSIGAGAAETGEPASAEGLSAVWVGNLRPGWSSGLAPPIVGRRMIGLILSVAVCVCVGFIRTAFGGTAPATGSMLSAIVRSPCCKNFWCSEVQVLNGGRPRSHGHDFGFLGLKRGVNAGDALVRRLLDLVETLLHVVLGNLLVLLELLDRVVRIAADVAHRDLLRLGLGLRDLRDLLAALLVELRNRDAQDLAVRLRRHADVRGENRLVHRVDDRRVKRSDLDLTRLRRRNRAEILDRRRAAIVVDLDLVDHRRTRLAGPQTRILLLERIEALADLRSRVIQNVTHRFHLFLQCCFS